MRRFLFFLAILFLFFGCNNKIDRSNPETVAKEYFGLLVKGENKKAFELIADTCKKFFTLQDFLNYYKSYDSLKITKEYRVGKIVQLPFNPEHPNHRAFEIGYSIYSKDKRDTLLTKFRVTTMSEKNAWSVVWASIFMQSAQKNEDNQKFNEAIKIYKNVIALDPFHTRALKGVGWCYYKLDDLGRATDYAKRAIEVSPSDENYNLLAAIYSSKGERELAIENYNKALSLVDEESEKAYLLSNMSMEYAALENYAKAREVLDKALLLDSTFTHAWWSMGQLYKKLGNLDSSIICLYKATQFEPMESYLQSDLYFELSKYLLLEAKSISKEKTKKMETLDESQKYILKAMDISPDNEEYKKVLIDIKRMR